MPKFTVGMAVYDDLQGVKYTTQALRMYHWEYVDEIIIVDNNPLGKVAPFIRQWAAKIDARYIPLSFPQGTAAPRNAVFHFAQLDYVVCVDSHVMLSPDSFKSLSDYYTQFPDSKDLLSGPLLYDDLVGQETHFTDVWAAQMWGQWGYDQRVQEGKPFEIQAMGLGVFATRRDSWLGFNPGFRQFGGEEWYIHEKYRKAGHKCICIPGLSWWHDFGDYRKKQYPANDWNKVRNYVIGLRELDIPLDRLHQHYVIDSKKIDEYDWQCILEGATEPQPRPGNPVPSSCCGTPEPDVAIVDGKLRGFPLMQALFAQAGRQYIAIAFEGNPAPDVDTVNRFSALRAYVVGSSQDDVLILMRAPRV